MKKIFPFILAFLFGGLLVFAFLSKNILNDFISQKMKDQVGAEYAQSVEKQIDAKFNYLQSKEDFDFTLLEFGSTGCTVCKQMEPVLEEIRKLEEPKVNVVFMNIMHPENLEIMKYFGISAVPMQIILNKRGTEFFRHYGFIDSNDIIALMAVNSVQH